jgi:hypothetical protein
MVGIGARDRDSLRHMSGETCCHRDIVLKHWLNSVSKMAFLNGVDDFHFSEDVIEALAYAYHVNFVPIEAVAFLRLVANNMGDDDPVEAREVDARAQDLMLLSKSNEDYNADQVREHVSRFIEMAMSRQRQPERGRSLSIG